MRRFIDLFSGIGGFHVGLRRRGLECVFASEIDKAAAEAYRANFGHHPHGDICEVSNAEIPQHDILCAGFPCQPFSQSGTRGGLADARGQLFYEIVRIAKHHKPLVLLLENVKTILTLDGGTVASEIYRSLDAIGYKLDHVVLNSGAFGIPQQRERVYFVAVRKDSSMRFCPPQSTSSNTYLKSVLLPDEVTQDLVINRRDIVFDKPFEQPYKARPIRIGYLNKGGQGERIYSPNGHAITLSANGGGIGHRTGLYRVNGKVRRLHIDEAKHVMGFDPAHIVSDGISGYRQLGNAVVPSMITHVYDGIESA